jgi:hypothetical protein
MEELDEKKEKKKGPFQIEDSANLRGEIENSAKVLNGRKRTQKRSY